LTRVSRWGFFLHSYRNLLHVHYVGWCMVSMYYLLRTPWPLSWTLFLWNI
jgi:hypothetical protein